MLQVFEERREERKRIHEATDEMDRGRTKKVKKFHHYNRFNNNRNGYNPFQVTYNLYKTFVVIVIYLPPFIHAFKFNKLSPPSRSPTFRAIMLLVYL